MRPSTWRCCRDEPFRYLGRIENAGEILLGEHTPVTLGNFVLGPEPRAADQRLGPDRLAALGLRFHEAHLGRHVTSPAYPELARHARTLATYEGFEAHANAVSETRDRLLGADRANDRR